MNQLWQTVCLEVGSQTETVPHFRPNSPAPVALELYGLVTWTQSRKSRGTSALNFLTPLGEEEEEEEELIRNFWRRGPTTAARQFALNPDFRREGGREGGTEAEAGIREWVLRCKALVVPAVFAHMSHDSFEVGRRRKAQRGVSTIVIHRSFIRLCLSSRHCSVSL